MIILDRAPAFTLASLLLVSGSVISTAEAKITFSIPSEPMSQAFYDLGRIADVSILYDPEVVKNRIAPRLDRELSSREALQELIAGTALHVVQVNDRTFVVLPKVTSADVQNESGQSAPDPSKDHPKLDQKSEGLNRRSELTNYLSPQSVRDGGQSPAFAEVIVTAEKREEKIQDVPISITALGESELDKLGAKQLSDFVRNVPNFDFEPGPFGASSLSIRGIASNVGAATVGVYIDETPVQVYQGSFTGNASPVVFDLDRVEILRGPQGTLYGASSMGGTLRYITRQPSLTTFSGRAVTEFAGTDGGSPSWQTAAAVGGPLKENELGYRLSAYYRRDGGYVDNVDPLSGTVRHRNVNNNNTVALRGALKGSLGDAFEITLSGFYQNIIRDELPFTERPVPAAVLDPAVPQPEYSFRPLTQSFRIAEPGREWFFLPSLAIVGDFDSVSLTSITSYMYRRDTQILDYTGLIGDFVLGAVGLEEPGGSTNYASTRQVNFSQELRIASSEKNDRVHWVVGGFFSNSEIQSFQQVIDHNLNSFLESLYGADVEQLLGLPLLPGDVSYQGFFRTVEQQLAGFGQVSWKIIPSIELVGGMRISRSRVTVQTVSDGPLNGGPTPLDQAKPSHQEDKPFTPLASINIRPWNDQLIYGTVSRGFRAGGGNGEVPTSVCGDELSQLGLSVAPATFNADRTQNYEIGYKGSFSPLRLMASFAAFRVDWTDIQQNIGFKCGFGFTGNLGKARSQGFELELQKELFGGGLLLHGSGGFSDAKFRQAIALGPGETIVDEGARIPSVPRWTAAAGVEQRFRFGWGRAYIRGDYRFRGDIALSSLTSQLQSDPFSDPFFSRRSSYRYVTARSGVSWNRWEFALFADNLLNDRPTLLRDASLYPISLTFARELTVRPRTVGVSVSCIF